jgi:adenylate cyclase
MGDAAAAGLMERFADLVRQAAHEHNGTVVKQIGDEFMLVFTDPTDAIACGVDIEAAASDQAQFPAVRQGAHTGRPCTGRATTSGPPSTLPPVSSLKPTGTSSW